MEAGARGPLPAQRAAGRSERVGFDYAEGMSFEETYAKAMAGGYAAEQAPVEIPEVS